MGGVTTGDLTEAQDKAQPSRTRTLGHDLSFDGEGRVTRVQSLYNS
ncbi:hypothetical protein ACGRHY_13775 [Streptomyces sp. HK10]